MLSMCYVRPMATDQLEGFPFLQSLSEDGQGRLRRGARTVVPEPGTPVLNRGDAVSGVYLVQSGALRVFYITQEGREGTLYWVEPGQSCILALNCTFARIPYPAWVEADRSATQVTVIPGDLYRSLFDTEPVIQKFTFDALSGRLFELMGRLEQASSLGVEQRLAGLLLREGRATGEVLMSQERLARHLGTAREVVSRTLRHIAERGCLRLFPGKITILNKSHLESVAAGGRESL